MKKIILHLPNRSYPIIIADSFSFLPYFLKKVSVGNYACIVTNSKISRIFAASLISSLKKVGISSRLFLVKDTEASKSFEVARLLIERILNVDKKKRIFIIALGGGVIGDLAGFVASVYKRGVPFIQIPTTLLGQVDSAIGGKVAIDVKKAKNIIGTFYQPQLVYSNLATLKTLPLNEIKAGLAEIIKYAMIKDKELFGLLERKIESLLNREKEILERVIFKCAQIKALIIEEDEKEKKGKRTILNFGHTFGHAIEAASFYSRKFSHGQAIAIGMLMACDLAVSLGVCSDRVTERLETIIKRAGLPTCVIGLKLKDILSSLQYDKKFIYGKTRFVLPLSVGKVRVFEDIDVKKIKQVCQSRMKND
jgi:3-dehydroquinate synthase